MRPKLIALIAVSAVALVGCGAAEQTQNVATTPNAQEEKPCGPEDAKNGMVCDPLSGALMTAEEFKESGEIEEAPVDTAVVEEQFADFAELRAEMHGAAKPDRENVADSLHEFCESGEPFDVSKTDSLNENLEVIADSTYCEMFETN